MSWIGKFLLVLFIPSLFLYSQNETGSVSYLYEKGIGALAEGDFNLAENYFEESIRTFEDPSSYFELAKLNLKKDYPVARAKALRLFKKAVWKDPSNLNYRSAYASLLEDFAKFSAINQYEKILELDNTNTNAWVKLAEIKGKEFDEYYNSVRMLREDILSPLDEYALEDFDEAEYYYLKALETDNNNTDILLKLAFLYERKDSLDASINILEKLVNIDPASKDGHLYLGLCYNLTERYEESHKEYVKAISLMPSEEKEDFTLNSVVELIEPVFKGLTDVKETWYVKNIVNAYWKMNDPLFTEGINERLLEHYSRMAYSNLHYSVPDMNLLGWKTDRGKTILRYGLPKDRVRIRPMMGGRKISMKTEIWNYDDMTFGFTDQFLSGNFVYSAPMGETSRYAAQFYGDSHSYAQNLKNVRHQYYNPPFNGERFEFDYKIAQFKEKQHEGITDLYIYYSSIIKDSLLSADKELLGHRYSVNFFNNIFEEKFSYEGSKKLETTEHQEGKLLLENIIGVKAIPDTGLLAIKLFREYDNGIASRIERKKIRDFSPDKLDISDVLLASYIGEQKVERGFRRGNYFIKPVITGRVGREETLYLYYELYNLYAGEDGLTDFVVEIEISARSGEGLTDKIFSLFRDTMEMVGLASDESITMSASYKTPETDPQMFLQMNISELSGGEYTLKVKIQDKLGNLERLESTDFTIL